MEDQAGTKEYKSNKLSRVHNFVPLSNWHAPAAAVLNLAQLRVSAVFDHRRAVNTNTAQ
jgi:hypothetical protein